MQLDGDLLMTDFKYLTIEIRPCTDYQDRLPEGLSCEDGDAFESWME